MNSFEFFTQISQPVEGERDLLIEKLYRFVKAINTMSADDLVDLWQALRMLKMTQRSRWFRRNPIITNIIETQLVVIEAMRNLVHNEPPESGRNMARRFNSVIGGEWIRGYQHVIS